MANGSGLITRELLLPTFVIGHAEFIAVDETAEVIIARSGLRYAIQVLSERKSEPHTPVPYQEHRTLAQVALDVHDWRVVDRAIMADCEAIGMAFIATVEHGSEIFFRRAVECEFAKQTDKFTAGMM